MPSPVPAEDELIEIGLDVWPAEAVVDAQAQALQVREHPVDPGEKHMGGHHAHGFGQVPAALHALVGRQPVSQDVDPSTVFAATNSFSVAAV